MAAYFPRDESLVCGNPRRLSGDSDDVSQAEARLHFFPEYGGTNLEEELWLFLCSGVPPELMP
ncbi:hypothetical protein KSP40_PGU010350 [Platanthera guangdongensis]|uniref:Uncharacterized protein n=1 Tax=Platanthera guangdongensis TaxID=2320717 RepID=A0ABR2MQT3_9ASPA